MPCPANRRVRGLLLQEIQWCHSFQQRPRYGAVIDPTGAHRGSLLCVFCSSSTPMHTPCWRSQPESPLAMPSSVQWQRGRDLMHGAELCCHAVATNVPTTCDREPSIRRFVPAGPNTQAAYKRRRHRHARHADARHAQQPPTQTRQRGGAYHIRC